MKIRFSWLLLLSTLFLGFSCSEDTESRTEIDRLEAVLAEREAALMAALEAGGEHMAAQENVIVHTVYLKLRKDLEENQLTTLIEKLKKMEKIEGVRNFRIGTFQDLQDPRAMSDYELALQMEFLDEQTYRSYQEDPVHLAIRESLKAFLAGPPLTHDFVTR